MKKYGEYMQEEQEAQMAAQWEENGKRLKRERRVLEKQSQALLRLPGRKERSEVRRLHCHLQACQLHASILGSGQLQVPVTSKALPWQ